MAVQTDEMAAGVTQLILDEWNDGLARSTPLWDMVVKGDGREKESGGTYLQFPIKLIKNAAQGFIGGSGGVVSITPSIQTQYGVLNWKFFQWGTNFTLNDYTIANGEQDKIKILAKKIKGSIADANRAMAQSSHVGSGSDSLAFEGLADVGAASGKICASRKNRVKSVESEMTIPREGLNTPVTRRAEIMLQEYPTLLKMYKVKMYAELN
jgi:hypothetical protein